MSTKFMLAGIIAVAVALFWTFAGLVIADTEQAYLLGLGVLWPLPLVLLGIGTVIDE